MRRLALLLGLLLSSCDDGETAVEHACRKNSDCPRAGMVCVVPAGVCVGFSTPLEVPVDAGLDR